MPKWDRDVKTNNNESEEGYCPNCGVLIIDEDEHWCPFMLDDEPLELNFDDNDDND